MNTKFIMIASAIFLGLSGAVLTFMPAEISKLSDVSGDPILFQIMGALYLGFAVLNWTAKANIIGGIYSRPVVIGNLTHFLVAGLALSKWAFQNSQALYVWIIVIVYLIFTLLFSYLLFNSPKVSRG